MILLHLKHSTHSTSVTAAFGNVYE